MNIAFRTSSCVVFLFAGVLSAPALAQPPAHAPAHGWRKQHDPYYVGYAGKHWEQDYGIHVGRCDREAIATVLGGIAGGVIASRVAEPENRAVATIIGAAAGALIGNRIGRELDEADRGCLGHALELGEAGRKIQWTSGPTGVRYEVIPGRDRQLDDSGPCREFTLVAVDDAGSASRRGIACRSEPGAWEIVG